MKKFKHDFGRGVSCEMRVSDTPPGRGSTHILGIEWEGKPDQGHIREYVEWQNDVQQTLADDWNIKIMQVFPDPDGGAEMWLYAPGGAPERLFL
jgi:hypothetical protein